MQVYPTINSLYFLKKGLILRGIDIKQIVLVIPVNAKQSKQKSLGHPFCSEIILNIVQDHLKSLGLVIHKDSSIFNLLSNDGKLNGIEVKVTSYFIYC